MAEEQGLVSDSFDIDKVVNAGFKLEYIAPTTQNESINHEIKLEDISLKVEYWKKSIVCYVLGAHSPYAVIKVFIQRISKNGVVLV